MMDLIGGWYQPAPADAVFLSMMPRPLPEPAEAQVLQKLPRRLAEAGYTDKELEQFVGDLPLIARRYEQLPGYLHHCRRVDSETARLAQLFLFRQTRPRAEVDKLIGSDVAELLIKYRKLEQSGDEVMALADLYPCMERCFFTDAKWSTYQRLPNHVYDVSGDSYGLAYLVERPQLGRALDLGLGSGIHAILAASHSREVVGVDVNPRAISFTTFNAMMNGVAQRCDFRHGSLLEPVQGERFDQITGNLPFVPTPSDETLELYRPGGETGEELIETVISQIDQVLNPGGTLYLVATYPIMRDSHYLERITRWLGGGQGWGIGLINYGLMTRELYIETQIEDYAGPRKTAEFTRRFQSWIDCYEKHGIDAIREGVVCLRKLPDPSHPGFAVECEIPLATAPVTECTGWWLKALERFHSGWSPDWESWKPRYHPALSQVFQGLLEPHGLARYKNPKWWPEQVLSSEELTLATLLDGDKTAGQLAQEAGLEKSAARKALAGLGQKLLLD